MKRIIAMIIALALIGCLPAVAGEKPAFEFIVPVTEAELLPGAAVDVGGQFTVSTTAFDFEDDLGYYRPGSDRVGAAGDYYHSGADAEFAVLRVDIDNGSRTARNFLQDCEVRAYDGVHTYGGWAFQQNFANGISADLSYGRDSERQNIRWAISAEDVYDIAPSARGHYIFGCTLPNEVVEGEGPLWFEITMKEAKLAYHIRGDGTQANAGASLPVNAIGADPATEAPTVEPTAMPTAEPTPTPEPTRAPVVETVYLPALRKGDAGSGVMSLQKLLNALGYLSDAADGDFGKRTEAAVQAAQLQAGLPATGVADSAFLNELYGGRVPDAMGNAAQLSPQMVTCGETSHHTERSGAYTAANVFDGKTYTCWAEGASGDGIGEGIFFTVATFGRSRITLNIYNGYHKSYQRYRQNGRPRDITLYVNGTPMEYTFSDEMVPEAIVIDGLDGRSFAEFRLTVDSVYRGSEWRDTCISEIEIY